MFSRMKVCRMMLCRMMLCSSSSGVNSSPRMGSSWAGGFCGGVSSSNGGEDAPAGWWGWSVLGHPPTRRKSMSAQMVMMEIRESPPMEFSPSALVLFFTICSLSFLPYTYISYPIIVRILLLMYLPRLESRHPSPKRALGKKRRRKLRLR